MVFRQLDELSKSKEEALIEMADEYEEKLNLKDAIIQEVRFVLTDSSTDPKLRFETRFTAIAGWKLKYIILTCFNLMQYLTNSVIGACNIPHVS